jgi:hypothetical protein
LPAANPVTALQEFREDQAAPGGKHPVKTNLADSATVKPAIAQPAGPWLTTYVHPPAIFHPLELSERG